MNFSKSSRGRRRRARWSTSAPASVRWTRLGDCRDINCMMPMRWACRMIYPSEVGRCIWGGEPTVAGTACCLPRNGDQLQEFDDSPRAIDSEDCCLRFGRHALLTTPRAKRRPPKMGTATVTCRGRMVMVARAVKRKARRAPRRTGKSDSWPGQSPHRWGKSGEPLTTLARARRIIETETQYHYYQLASLCSHTRSRETSLLASTWA